MNLTLYISAAALGLLGSMHCVGMCGPITLAVPFSGSGMKRTFGILTYNTGRITTYGLLGILFGLFGTGLKLAGALQVLSIVFGVVMLLFLVVPGIMQKFVPSTLWYVRFNNFVKQKMQRLFQRKGGTALFTLGALNGLLPCGLIFIALATAVASGSVTDGAIFMLIFGLGTFPAMVIVPLLGSLLKSRFSTTLKKSMVYITAIVAVLMIVRGMNLDIPYLSPKVSSDHAQVHDCCKRK